jgi:hypothetical protein
MKKLKLITTPARLSRAYLDSLSDIDDQAWEVKAERLQARRWRKLRQQLA